MKKLKSDKFASLSDGPLEKGLAHFKRLDRKLFLSEFICCQLLAAFALLIVHHEITSPTLPGFKENQVAVSTVRVRKSIEVEDREATETERAQILARIPEVFDYDSSLFQKALDRWKLSIRFARALKKKEKSLSDRAQLFSERLALSVSEKEYAVLEKLKLSSDLEKSVHFALAPLWDRKIIHNKEALNFSIELFDIKSKASALLRIRDLTSVLGLEEAQSLVGKGGREGSPKIKDAKFLPWSKWSVEDRAVVFALQSRLVEANVTPNKKETEARRAAALTGFRPLIQKLAKGEVIVREGERVGKKAARLIKELNAQSAHHSIPPSLPFEIIFLGFSLWVVIFYLRKQNPEIFRNNKDTWVTAAGLILSLSFFKLLLIFHLDFMAEHFSTIPPAFFLFLMPVAAPAMILRLLLNRGLTVSFCVLYALGAAVLMEKAALYGSYVFLVSLMGSFFLAHCRTRGELYQGGLWTALVGGVAAALLMAAWGWQIPFSASFLQEVHDSFDSNLSNSLWAFAAGAVGSWVASALTLMITPILENLLDYTTDLKLLELARMDHPLLRDLVLKAPGTYHHSIIVGSLVEAGAESIGANALLARVGSYYHDIGKIGRAEYFIENQSSGQNPHEHTRPQLSARIIISHVKDGRALAESHKLGQSLIDFIEQHHGTSLVSYFYNKAKQEAAQPGSSISPEEVREEDYRYPGPKPQSKENAILCLADSCEAATRSLVDPTPARIEGMVKKIVSRALSEGHLDESDITLREISLVSSAFVRILMGIHHNRIQYPDQEKDLPSSKVALLKAK